MTARVERDGEHETDPAVLVKPGCSGLWIVFGADPRDVRPADDNVQVVGSAEVDYADAWRALFPDANGAASVTPSGRINAAKGMR